MARTLTFPTDLMLTGNIRMKRVIDSLSHAIMNVTFEHKTVDEFNGELIVTIPVTMSSEDIFHLGITVGIAMMVK